MPRKQHAPLICACDSGLAAADCCAPLLAGQRTAGSAEALMRSRYSAYVALDEAYLLATWHPETRPARLDLQAQPQPKWLGLQVQQHVVLDAEHATVQFTAKFKVQGRMQHLHELSLFERVDGHWFYLRALDEDETET